jgi:hypothetical protein
MLTILFSILIVNVIVLSNWFLLYLNICFAFVLLLLLLLWSAFTLQSTSEDWDLKRWLLRRTPLKPVEIFISTDAWTQHRNLKKQGNVTLQKSS